MSVRAALGWVAACALLVAGCHADKERPVLEAAPPSAGSSIPGAASARVITEAGPSVASAPAEWTKLPAVAVWRRHGGHPVPGMKFPGPALRAALWEDGRMVFAEDRSSWTSPLREGRVEPGLVKKALDELTSSGVFELRGTTYLVPDAPVLVALVRVGSREQILYWDEVETANHGINIQPKPQHIAFKKAWYAIGKVLNDRAPRESVSFSSAFEPPAKWYVKPAIQSE